MQLLLTMYNIALVGSVIVVVFVAAEVYQATTRVFITIGILWITVFSSCIFVVPKLFQIRSRKLNPVEDDEPARRTSMRIVGNVPNSFQRMGRRFSHRYSQNSGISFGDQNDDYEDNIGSSVRSTQATSFKPPMDAIQELRTNSEENRSQIFRSEEHPSDEKSSSESNSPEKSSTRGSTSKSSSSSS